jgi:hypothetical protein
MWILAAFGNSLFTAQADFGNSEIRQKFDHVFIGAVLKYLENNFSGTKRQKNVNKTYNRSHRK